MTAAAAVAAAVTDSLTEDLQHELYMVSSSNGRTTWPCFHNTFMKSDFKQCSHFTAAKY